MTFHDQHLLWLLAIPALLFAFDLQRRFRAVRRTARADGSSKVLTATIGARSATTNSAFSPQPSALSPRLRWRLALGIALSITALARPQWGRIEQPVFEQAREILIAVDLSRSMLADDVKPSRLDRARLLIQSLLNQLAGERVGLLVFAGTAFLQSPLSSDYEILREFLPELGPDYLPHGGTNYSALLNSALDSFSTGDADRFLIVLSDGEADPADPWRPLADKAKERGIHVIGLGVGTETGAMIPDGQNGFIKDERGAVVLSRLESATLRELADKTAGVYTDASQWVDLAGLIKTTIERGRKGDFQESARSLLIERYQWALGPALFFLLWSLWREFPVHPRPRRIALRTTAATLLLLASGADIPPAHAATPSEISTEAAGRQLDNSKSQIPSLLPSTDPDDPHAPPATVDSSAASAALSKLVTRLAEQPALSARDAASLADATLAYGEPLRAQGKPVPNGPVDDALQAIAQAEKKSPSAADWTRLRAALEQLKEKQQPPPEQQQQQQNQQNDSQQQQGQQGQSGDKNNQSQQSQDKQSQDQQQQNGEQQPQSQQNNEQQDQSKSPSDNQQSDESQQQQQNGGQQQKPNTPAQSAFEPKSQQEDKAGEEQAKANEAEKQNPPPPDETQRVGGTATGSSPIDKNTDPNLIAPLQRLERLKESDSPAELFQLMQDQPRQPEKTGRNW